MRRACYLLAFQCGAVCRPLLHIISVAQHTGYRPCIQVLRMSLIKSMEVNYEKEQMLAVNSFLSVQLWRGH